MPAGRLRITLTCIAFALTIFAARLVQLEGFDSAAYKTSSSQSHPPAMISLPAVRGDITTSDGELLVTTVQDETVFADPMQIPQADRQQVADRLAGPLNKPASAILEMLNHPSSPEYVALATNVGQGTGSRVSALKLPGIDMTPTYTTQYPNGSLAGPLTGFTSTDDKTGTTKGNTGLEQQYNALLAGRPGREYAERGSAGEPIPGTEVTVTPAVPARSLRLTIQSGIQYVADQVCQQRVEQTHAKNCSIVVMQPQTGAILAMAQWPTYNPATVSGYPGTTNIALADSFAPGSTLKPVTVAAAIEHGGQTPTSAYKVPPAITLDGQTFHDAEAHPTEHLTIAGILANSSNVGMVQVAHQITEQQQYDYLRAFGLDATSGLAPPGQEVTGQVAAPGSAGYSGISRDEYAFGQGLSVTAVQMASIYATIANGGVRVRPTLVAGTTSATGQFTAAPRPQARRVIKASTASQLMAMLEQVPATNAAGGQDWGVIPGYAVASKTGTAQVAGANGCALCQYGSSYIGIAPAASPQLVVAVNIQQPQKGYYGIQVAGPAFYDVMRAALQDMKIAPDAARAPHIALTAP